MKSPRWYRIRRGHEGPEIMGLGVRCIWADGHRLTCYVPFLDVKRSRRSSNS